ncbi:proteasome subunit alpha type-1 isoform X1 [Procambarus clarkii]|uniref:proteasome subunit alpha type-1 isoform X1 n=2 Tax=Procambarus clarkii TaxID=6728 RepID=UPI001E672658|nr:proteasome subunit alpha type-1-like [Procambarus clarkii]
MFRNQYDNDVTVWSPQGRLHQVEYAMEAVKQGSATVGVKSSSHAVLVALKRASSELAAHQKKIMPIDKHIAVSISGLTADARVLSRFMRTECLNEHFAHNQALSLNKLMERVGAKMQIATQRYDKRPYGVGLLLAGFDEDGPHIYQTCPSANYYDCQAMAIGARSQSARTYLERHLEEFRNSAREELIRHALRALRDTLPNDVELTNKNCSIAVVGKDEDLSIYDDDDVNPYLEGLDQEERRGGTGAPRDAQPPAGGDDAAAASSTDAAASAAAPPPPPTDDQPQDSMDTD